jgi:hypothetical protein
MRLKGGLHQAPVASADVQPRRRVRAGNLVPGRIEVLGARERRQAAVVQMPATPGAGLMLGACGRSTGLGGEREVVEQAGLDALRISDGAAQRRGGGGGAALPRDQRVAVRGKQQARLHHQGTARLQRRLQCRKRVVRPDVAIAVVRVPSSELGVLRGHVYERVCVEGAFGNVCERRQLVQSKGRAGISRVRRTPAHQPGLPPASPSRGSSQS